MQKLSFRKHDLDEILDEIDSVLEKNAEEFVKAYVQKAASSPAVVRPEPKKPLT